MSTEPVLPELPPGRVQIGLTPPFKEVIYGADAVRAIQSAAFKAGREQGLEEAAKACKTAANQGETTFAASHPADFLVRLATKGAILQATKLEAAIRSMAEGSAG